MAILITLSCIILHLFFLFHAGGLWRDEVNLVNLAHFHSLGEMAKDSFPVLMPLLVKGWMTLLPVHGDFGIRILGTLIGVGIIAIMWLCALKIQRPPLWGLVLFGANAAVIYYGDSLRAYGLGCLLILLAMTAMMFALKKPDWWRCGAFSLAAILAVQALYQNAVFVAALAAGGICVVCRRGDFVTAIKILIASSMAALSLLPYFSQIHGLTTTHDPLRVGFSLYTALANCNQLVGWPQQFFSIIWIFLIYVMFCVLAVLTFFPRKNRLSLLTRNEHLLFACVTIIVAIVGYTAFLFLAGRRTEPWYFLPLAAIVAVCFDTGFSFLSLPKPIQTTAFGVIIVAAFLQISHAPSHLSVRLTNVDQLARQLRNTANRDDFVLVTPWFCGISFDRYCGSSLHWQTIPFISDHSRHRYDLLQEEMQNTEMLEPLFQRIKLTLQSGHDVWIVSARTGIGVMSIPDGGRRCPSLLPPPLKESGWGEAPYCDNWAAVVAWFLKQNCSEFYEVTNAPTFEANHYENLKLLVAAGWRG